MELEQSGALLESGTYEGEMWERLRGERRCSGSRRLGVWSYFEMYSALLQCEYLYLINQMCQVTQLK